MNHLSYFREVIDVHWPWYFTFWTDRLHTGYSCPRAYSCQFSFSSQDCVRKRRANGQTDGRKSKTHDVAYRPKTVV